MVDPLKVNEIAPIWLTTKEVQKMFGKSQTAVLTALYKSNVWARQCRYGETWLVEYWSCVMFWGKPLDPMEIQLIMEDLEDVRPTNR